MTAILNPVRGILEGPSSPPFRWFAEASHHDSPSLFNYSARIILGCGNPGALNDFLTTFVLQIHGTGLGLPLSQSIVDATGSRLTVTSVLREGSTFGLWLPIAPYTSAKRVVLR